MAVVWFECFPGDFTEQQRNSHNNTGTKKSYKHVQRMMFQAASQSHALPCLTFARLSPESRRISTSISRAIKIYLADPAQNKRATNCSCLPRINRFRDGALSLLQAPLLWRSFMGELVVHSMSSLCLRLGVNNNLPWFSQILIEGHSGAVYRPFQLIWLPFAKF